VTSVGPSNGQRYRITVALALFLLTLAVAPADTPSPAIKIDRIVILKSARQMTLMRGGNPVKTYKVALGTVPVGAKQRQGDHKTPEGNYTIDSKTEHSRFYRALHISYPSAADRERAKMSVSPGGDVEIHGLGGKYGWVGDAHREYDWTDGCAAVTNQEIDEIWPMIAVGTPVEIRP
jgi:murein L,D-transpeptidase YafK